MAKLVFALNQSLDGYVDHDHMAFAPDPVLFRHFIEDVRGLCSAAASRSSRGRGLHCASLRAIALARA